MSLNQLQDFYKKTITVLTSTGAGNIYVSAKPTVANGYLVISPSNTSLREIVRYTGTGTDGTGDYVIVASAGDRGLGGTVAQAHQVGESIRMNITAEHWADMIADFTQLQNDLATAILAGALDADAIVKGISLLSVAPDTSIGASTITIASPAVVTKTTHGLIAGDSVKFTTTGALPTGLLPDTRYYVLSSGLTANDFQLSSTPGGTAINTSGSQSGIHTLIKITPVAVGTNDPRIPTPAQVAAFPTANEKAALAGTQGVPSSTNKYATSDFVTTSSTDQIQSTRNAGIEVGEGNVTLRKNKIAQSFVAGRTKIRGVSLYKDADTGTFTGTITIDLYADSADAPTGGSLATVTISNTKWTGISVGEFTSLFSSEYASLVSGTKYWIQITTSTSDNSNHPNLGINSAGGYSSGTVRYNNSTDGLVTSGSSDLYFKTLEGNNNQIIKTDATGKIPSDFYDITKMPVPAYFQKISASDGQNEAAEANNRGCTSNADGSVLYVINGGNGYKLARYTRDAITGAYIRTHGTSASFNVSSQPAGIVLVGAYIYVVYDGGTNEAVYRYSASDLTGETLITVPAIAQAGTVASIAWTDGTFIYWLTTNSSTVYKWSISGTTLSSVTTGTADSSLWNNGMNYGGTFFDGNNVYAFGFITSGNARIVKLGNLFGVGNTTTNYIYNAYTFSDFAGGIIACPIDSNRMYIGTHQYDAPTSSSTTVRPYIQLTPVTKP